MPTNRLYRSLRDLLLQLRPKERKTRIRNFSWLLVGLFLSRSVYLSKIANKIPTTKATLPSAVRRLSRLVDNAAISVREWYEPLARRLLECQAQSLGGEEVRLIVDGTKVGFKHRLLMVGLAYRKRAIPIAWSWVRSEKGHSSSYKQRALFWTMCDLLCPTEQCAGFGGWRQRIWSDKGDRAVGGVGLVLRDASKEFSSGVFQAPPPVAYIIGGDDRAERRKGMAGGRPVEPLTRPQDESGAAVLEEGRRGAVAVGNQPCKL